MYIKLNNGQPEIYSIDKLYRDNPNTSFPNIIGDSFLSDYGIYAYTRPIRPQYDVLVERIIDGVFEQDLNGSWVHTYVIEQLSLEQASANIRTARNKLISNTDFMALSDNIMPSVFADYRQALRDITSQAGFPFAVNWPIAPV